MENNDYRQQQEVQEQAQYELEKALKNAAAVGLSLNDLQMLCWGCGVQFSRLGIPETYSQPWRK